MAASVTRCNFLMRTQLTRANAVSPGADAPISVSLPYGDAQVEFGTGSSAGEVNKGGFGLISLASSTPQTIDLTALGSVAGWQGNTSFSTVRLLAFYLLDDFAVTVGNAASDSFQGPLSPGATYTIPAGREWGFCADATTGYSTTGATDILLDPGANAVDVLVVVAGT